MQARKMLQEFMRFMSNFAIIQYIEGVNLPAVRVYFTRFPRCLCMGSRPSSVWLTFPHVTFLLQPFLVIPSLAIFTLLFWREKSPSLCSAFINVTFHQTCDHVRPGLSWVWVAMAASLHFSHTYHHQVNHPHSGAESFFLSPFDPFFCCSLLFFRPQWGG